MQRLLAALPLALTLVACSGPPPARSTPSATPSPSSPSGPLVERVGDTGFIQLQAESFQRLDDRQKQLAYWLTQAAIAIDPIIYDQLSGSALRQKRVLEQIAAHPAGVPAEALKKIRDYSLLFWGNRGNHNETTAQKFVPDFTFDELKSAALRAQGNGGFQTASGDLPPLPTAEALGKELDDLRPAFFDASFEPTITAKSPPPGQDILQASANTFYPGLSLRDLAGFKERYPLTSRVTRGPGGKLREEVYRAGTPDGKVPPGLYAAYLRKANEHLEKARALADPAQAQVIADLIRFYQTGEFSDWLQFGGSWVRNDAPVDFANGFIEVYRDARGAKGSSQAFVSITDQPLTDAMVKLAKNAAYFEEKAPWDAKYKRRDFQPPVVKAVEVLIETGDFHVTTIGDNLPNEDEIHARYGTKNFLFTASSHALSKAVGTGLAAEFDASPEEAARDQKYGEQAQDLLTAMHEVIGHGSGKLSDRLTGQASSYLKEQFSALEEARADLMGLWNIWDPKLKELGLVTDQEEVARDMYDIAARAPLTQLRRIPVGTTIEEDHLRDRALISNYIADQTGAIEQFQRDGKTYVRVTDYQKMRQGVGQLLAELMRIKAEGDYKAIKALSDRYVKFDPAVRDQIVARFKGLRTPTYWAGINPELTLEGNTVKVAYPRDAVRQYLRYGSMYDAGLRP
jgi:dipeptidyl-peptidase III